MVEDARMDSFYVSQVAVWAFMSGCAVVLGIIGLAALEQALNQLMMWLVRVWLWVDGVRNGRPGGKSQADGGTACPGTNEEDC